MVLADNSKHNSNGRVDETGMIRHRDVELCPIGALGLHLFAVYHLQDSDRPNFAPDFSDIAKSEGYGQYGKREWYCFKVFPGADPCTAMVYNSEYHYPTPSLHAVFPHTSS